MWKMRATSHIFINNEYYTFVKLGICEADINWVVFPNNYYMTWKNLKSRLKKNREVQHCKVSKDVITG